MMQTFMAMYAVSRGEIYLAKAKAMADAIVNVQCPNGLIPTHWMKPKHRCDAGFWPNCMFFATEKLEKLAECFGGVRYC